MSPESSLRRWAYASLASVGVSLIFTLAAYDTLEYPGRYTNTQVLVATFGTLATFLVAGVCGGRLFTLARRQLSAEPEPEPVTAEDERIVAPEDMHYDPVPGSFDEPLHLCDARHPEHPRVQCYRLKGHNQAEWARKMLQHVGWDDQLGEFRRWPKPPEGEK